jgi:hypothetical protein
MILDDVRFIRAVGASRGPQVLRARRERPRRRAAEKRDETPAASSLDHLVGAGEQRGG